MGNVQSVPPVYHIHLTADEDSRQGLHISGNVQQTLMMMMFIFHIP
jgi:hypothetical protein